jgi:cytochrome c
MKSLIRACALLIVVVPPAMADAKRGERLAQEKCGACHSVGARGSSPDLKAPLFRAIAVQWPPEQLQEALAEGIVTGHNAMPEFTFSPRQIDDLVDHLNRLRRRR